MWYDANQRAISFIHDIMFYHYSALSQNDFYFYKFSFSHFMFTNEKSANPRMSPSNPPALESGEIRLEPVPVSIHSPTSQVNLHLKYLMPACGQKSGAHEGSRRTLWTVYEITLKVSWQSLPWTMKLRTTPWAVEILGCQNKLHEWSHHTQELAMNEQNLVISFKLLLFQANVTHSSI